MPWLPGQINPTSWTGWGRAVPIAASVGWLSLAWLSHYSPASMVWWLLGVLSVQWLLAVFAWRSASVATSSSWLAWGLAFRFLGLFATPILEDDHFRFLWDGRMLATTGNPYASAPSAHFTDATLPTEFAEVLDRLNNPDLPTIYGPLTEFGFFASYLLHPAALWPWKLFLLGADIALLLLLRRVGHGEAGAQAAVFAAWCPLSIFETAFNAHPDALAVSLLMVALVARSRRWDGWLGLACGAAIGAKVFALLVVPYLLWRRPGKAWLAFIAAVLACYAPFWLQGSGADLTALFTFAREWEFNSSAYALLAGWLGPVRAHFAAGSIFLAGWLVLFVRWTRRSSSEPALPPGQAVFTLFFLLSPVFNPWYALWLLPFCAWRVSPTGFAVLSAVSLSYLTQQNLDAGALDGFAHPDWVRPVEFGLIGAALLFEFWQRHHSRIPTLKRQCA